MVLNVILEKGSALCWGVLVTPALLLSCHIPDGSTAEF